MEAPLTLLQRLTLARMHLLQGSYMRSDLGSNGLSSSSIWYHFEISKVSQYIDSYLQPHYANAPYANWLPWSLSSTRTRMSKSWEHPVRFEVIKKTETSCITRSTIVFDIKDGFEPNASYVSILGFMDIMQAVTKYLEKTNHRCEDSLTLLNHSQECEADELVELNEFAARVALQIARNLTDSFWVARMVYYPRILSALQHNWKNPKPSMNLQST
ncbi:hypothetical protein RJ639_004321 [Escallonia herrerae]|uniref:Uncharacterized protein n=1 Tax=Escallonia herrerae TaxID=1293975 RepID=A0AA88W4I0_9ASTE|nr:hypothetical protein RJ639_004321 [Escallonia herrerae]